ncbi:MAG: hypothetical protein RL569_629, partial [Actinomycetota bacterium]
LVCHQLGGEGFSELRPKELQLAQGRRVKGSHLHPRRTEIAHSGAQFAGRSIGICECKDSVGGVDAGFDTVSDSMRDGSGLSTSSSGNYANWAKQSFGRNPLLVV